MSGRQRVRLREFLVLAFTALAICVAPSRARAQGGPPMITDDPGTPGPGRWENNLAVALERRGGERAFNLPGIDLNYGVGEHVQLTLQSAFAVLQRGGATLAGPGGAEAAVKWRFLDQAQFGADVSMFPRVLFSVAASSVRRGLAEEGTRVQFPFQAARRFGRVGADVEAGPFYSSVEGARWLYGIVAGVDLTEGTTVMAEVHGNAAVDFANDALVLNAGLRQVLGDHAILIASAGHEVRTVEAEGLALVAYLGVQLLW